MNTPTDSSPGYPFDHGIYARLVQGAKDAGSIDRAWLFLEAAHVVGQLHIKQHAQTHALMLSLAWRTRDWREVAGQLFRLVLVPIGHLIGRLPIGNPGRSTVSAFEPMPLRRELAELISQMT